MRASILVVALALGQEGLAVAAEDPHCASMPTMAGCSGAKANKQVQTLQVQQTQTPPSSTKTPPPTTPAGTPGADIAAGAGLEEASPEQLAEFERRHRELHQLLAEVRRHENSAVQRIAGNADEALEAFEARQKERQQQKLSGADVDDLLKAVTNTSILAKASGRLAEVDKELSGVPPPPAKDIVRLAIEGKKLGDELGAALTAMPAALHAGDADKGQDGPPIGLMQAGSKFEITKDLMAIGYTMDKGFSSHLSQMPAQNPTAPVYNYTAKVRAGAGDYAGAEKDASAALAIDSKNPEALATRAGARYNLKDYQGAVSDAKDALRLDPTNESAKGVLKFAEGRLGDPMSAPPPANPWFTAEGGARLGGNTIGPATAATPEQKDSQKWLADGKHFLDVRDFSRAQQAFDRAIDANPMNGDAHLNRAWIHLNTAGGRVADALADLKTVLKIAPKAAPAVIDKMARQLLKAGRFRDAKSVLELLAPDQRDASSWYDLAAANYGLGDRDAMMSALKRAAELDAARYGAKFERAKEAALGADLDFLFDQLPAQGREQPAKGATRAWRLERLVTLGLGGLVGFLLIAFGIMHGSSLSERWTTRGRDAMASQAPSDDIPAAAPEEASANTVGHFDLVRQIGLGGMGIVYEGLDRTLGRRVAIKKMREEIRVDPRERERFMSEARTVAKLRHPNIVEIHSIVEKGDDVYLVFEFVEGSTLYETLDRRGRLPLAEAVRVAEQAGEALSYAHQHDIIHRDLKPSNVMLGDGGAVKVMDFGVARQAKDAVSKLSMTNTIVGTPPYMAPEQEQGVVCKESDVYALGVCFYELVTGRLPFQGSGAGMLLNKLNKAYAPATTLAPELPAALDGFFARAFEPEPTRRFRTVSEFLSALRAVAAKR